MQNPDQASPDLIPDAQGYFVTSSTTESFMVPAWLSWLEVALLVVAALFALLLFIQRRNLETFCLCAGVSLIAACQIHAVLSVLLMQSQAAFSILAPMTPFVFWLRWVGPLFLAAHVLRLLRGSGRRPADGLQ